MHSNISHASVTRDTTQFQESWLHTSLISIISRMLKICTHIKSSISHSIHYKLNTPKEYELPQSISKVDLYTVTLKSIAAKWPHATVCWCQCQMDSVQKSGMAAVQIVVQMVAETVNTWCHTSNYVAAPQWNSTPHPSPFPSYPTESQKQFSYWIKEGSTRPNVDLTPITMT
jgi:hypothetical protein